MRNTIDNIYLFETILNFSIFHNTYTMYMYVNVLKFNIRYPTLLSYQLIYDKTRTSTWIYVHLNDHDYSVNRHHMSDRIMIII